MTGPAVVLAAARGEIDLDAPVTRYVPGLRWRPPFGPASAVSFQGARFARVTAPDPRDGL